jgi:hypothetical protein
MKKLNCLNSAPARLFTAIPLIFGLAAMVSAPTVEAVRGTVEINEVDIIDSGRVDVNEDTFIFNNDDLTDVLLWCNGATPVRVDIINGEVDVTENGVVDGNDDLSDCDLNDENSINGEQTPTRNRVTITDGLVDVDQLNGVTGDDVAPNVQLFRLTP